VLGRSKKQEEWGISDKATHVGKGRAMREQAGTVKCENCANSGTATLRKTFSRKYGNFTLEFSWRGSIKPGKNEEGLRAVFKHLSGLKRAAFLKNVAWWGGGR